MDPKTGCWIWLLGKLGDYGGAWDNRRGRMVQAHIALWEEKNGPVPPGKELHHKCERKLCVNPDHCIPKTRAEHKALHR